MRRRVAMLLAAMGILYGCFGKRPGPQPPPATQPGAAQPSATQPYTPVVRRWKPMAYSADEVHLIAMGDWGSDNVHQRNVAKSLAEYVSRTRQQFVGLISPGDNFYTRMKNGAEDREWQKLFEDMYDVSRLNMPFYNILGNHDYEYDKVKAQLEYPVRHPDSRFKFPSLWYRLDLPEECPMVTILMLESDRFAVSRQEWARQIAWMETELSKPRTTKWLMVCAHHPLFSNGLHGDIGLMQVEWGALLEKYGVDFYVSGHEHNLQHLEIPSWPMSFIVTGAGGRDKSKMRRLRGPFSRSIYGFVHFHLTDDRALVRYIDAKDSSIAHEFERDRWGRVRVLHSTASDKGDPKLKPQKPFDEREKSPPTVPSFDPERPASKKSAS